MERYPIGRARVIFGQAYAVPIPTAQPVHRLADHGDHFVRLVEGGLQKACDAVMIKACVLVLAASAEPNVCEIAQSLFNRG